MSRGLAWSPSLAGSWHIVGGQQELECLRKYSETRRLRAVDEFIPKCSDPAAGFSLLSHLLRLSRETGTEEKWMTKTRCQPQTRGDAYLTLFVKSQHSKR